MVTRGRVGHFQRAINKLLFLLLKERYEKEAKMCLRVALIYHLFIHVGVLLTRIDSLSGSAILQR